MLIWFLFWLTQVQGKTCTENTFLTNGGCQQCESGQYTDGTGCLPCSVGYYHETPSSTACRPCGYNQIQPQTGQTSCSACPKLYRERDNSCEQCPDVIVNVNAMQCCPGYILNDPLCLESCTCHKCTSGKYQQGNSCLNCDPGQISSGAAMFCLPCASTDITTDNIRCVTCASGQHKISGVHCGPCDVGKSGTTGVCTSCPTGQFQAETGQQQCKYCLAGQYQNKQGQTQCRNCEANQFSNIGATQCAATCTSPSFLTDGACVLCPIGQRFSSNSCEDCQPGKFGTPALMFNTTDCLDCPRGFYQDEYGADACQACPGAQVALQAGNTTCTDCPTGQVVSGISCAACKPGHFSKNGVCTDCPAGWQANSAGQGECQKCTRGTYTSFTGTATCHTCQTGHFQAQPGQTACSECPGGKFQAQSGQHGCSDCQGGKFQAQSGQHWCSDCPEGFVTTNRQTCHACPQGFYHNQSTHLCQTCSSGLLPNYYGTGSYKCVKCSHGQLCQACNSTSIFKGTQCEPCQTGKFSTGSLCQGCDSGKYAGKEGCIECAVGRSGTDKHCQDCLPGLYQDQTGQASCRSCLQGQYQDRSAQTNCTHCPDRHSTTSGASGALTDCTACAVGQYSQKGVCAICEGFIQQQECRQCPGGWLPPHTVGQSCLECPVGKVGQDGKSCQVCVRFDYQYQDESGKEVCKKCSGLPDSTSMSCPDCIAGTYQVQGSCRDCPIGRISKSRQQSCRQCSSGQSQASPGATTCTQCPEGQYQAELGQGSCNLCSRGKFQLYPGRNVCEDCRRGLYQDQPGKTDCKQCTAGTQTANVGASLLKECDSCPPGQSTGSTNRQGHSTGSTNRCTPCVEGTYQDIAGKTSCISCPAGKLSPEQSKSKEDCFDISSMESYVFGLKEDSKKPQSLTRDCEIRPNLVLLCSSCQCNRLSSLGFWGGPVCDVCARGYATSTCGVKCPGYDGLNDETICNNLGSCWFGKEGNGNCYCGGRSTIDPTAEKTVVDVRLCAKGEKCQDYGNDRLTQTEYKPIYYILEYRQYSVFVLKLNNFTPERGHMWFQRYTNHNWRFNDCTSCVGGYMPNSPHTYVGAYDGTGTYHKLATNAQTKNGFHGENCQYECGLCLNGGQCNQVPHPWKFHYTIYNTFESQTEISVPQTTCQCATKQFDESAMCCPNGFQPYISYGKRAAPSYARYSHRPYLTTIQTHPNTHPFWVDQDLWISDQGPPDYYIPSNNKITVSVGEDTHEVDYLHNGPYGKHVFYGQVQELCRACPGLFGKGIRQEEHLIQTHQDATKFLFQDGSYDTCNSIGVCDFYRKELEPRVRFMGNAQKYSRLKFGYSCSETAAKTVTARDITDCLAQQGTVFVTMYEDYVGIVDVKDLNTVATLAPVTGVVNLKRTHNFIPQGSSYCGTFLATQHSDPAQARQDCARHCTVKNLTTTGFSLKSNRCYCTNGCTLRQDASATHYTRTNDPVDNAVQVILYYKLTGPLPKPDHSGQYTVIQPAKNNCQGYDQCNLDLLQVVYGTSIYNNKTKGFGDDRLNSSTFDRFDTCFTYTDTPLVIDSYLTTKYEQGDDPFIGGTCPKGYFCTMNEDIGYKEACPIGYYQSEIGQTRTTPAVQCSKLMSDKLTSDMVHCQKNTATTTVHTLVDKVCIRCERNWYAPEGSAQCTQCPNGKVKKIAGTVPKEVQPVWNIPPWNWNNREKGDPLQWYVTLEEIGTEDQDCAQMPAGIIHVPQKNPEMSYHVPEFLPIVTCPYGYSSFRGTFVYDSDNRDFVKGLNTKGPSFSVPYIDSTSTSTSTATTLFQQSWFDIIATRCHMCPGNSVSGGDSTTCITCAANKMKTYMKQSIMKIVTRTVLQPEHNCWSSSTNVAKLVELAKIRDSTTCTAQDGEWKSGKKDTYYQSVGSQRLSNYKLKRATTETTCNDCIEVKFASLVDRNELEVSDCILLCSRYFDKLMGFIITKDSCLCKVPAQTTVTIIYDNRKSTTLPATCGTGWKKVTDQYTCRIQQYKLHAHTPTCTVSQTGVNRNRCSKTYSRFMELTACKEDNTIWWCCSDEWETCKRHLENPGTDTCGCYGLKDKDKTIPKGLQIGCLCQNEQTQTTSNLPIVDILPGWPTYVVSNTDNVDDWTGQALCSACQAGQHMVKDSISCKNCPVGQYQASSSDAIGNPACKGCPPGQYQDELGQQYCKYCAPGFYQVSTTVCQGCEHGKYQDDGGTTNCKDCSPGFYQNYVGQPNCVDCTPGKYQSEFGKTTCFFCKDPFGVDNGGTTCNPCSSGNVAVDNICQNCPQGWGAGTSSPCRACTIKEKSILENGGRHCQSCGIGKHDCDPCALGKYSPIVNNKGHCNDCPPGLYQDEIGLFSGCKNCVDGQYQSVSGQAFCLDCQSGRYIPRQSGRYTPRQIMCQDCGQVGHILGGWLETTTVMETETKTETKERGYFQHGPTSCSTANNAMPAISQYRGTDCIDCSYTYTTFVRNENEMDDQIKCYVLGTCHATGKVTVESRDSTDTWPSTTPITYGRYNTNTRDQSAQSTACDWSSDKTVEKKDSDWDDSCEQGSIHFTMKKGRSTLLRITFSPYMFPQPGPNGQNLNLWLNCFSKTVTTTPVTFWTYDPQNVNQDCRNEQINRSPPLTGLHSVQLEELKI